MGKGILQLARGGCGWHVRSFMLLPFPSGVWVFSTLNLRTLERVGVGIEASDAEQ